jgi:hemolysin activation/secretion protein
MQHFGHGRGRLAVATALVASVAAPGMLVAPAFGQVAGIPTRDDLKGITAAPAPEMPRLNIEGGIERSPCPLADPQFKDITVTIGAVEFNGLKGATPEELAPAWQPFASGAQPVAVLCEIRDAAATILRNKGYLAAVQVPTQRIENGKVVMEVLYARVTAVRAKGETRGAETKLEQYLGRLTEGEVFNRFQAERYLLLARDLPGYNVQLTLRPAGTGPGELIGEVTVVRQPYAVDLTIQNLASEATGRWGGQLRAQVFGLTGMGDATALSYYTTADFSEQHILQLSHEFRPGSDGVVVGGQFTYAWTKPDLGAAGGGASLDARTLYASLFARYPLVRSQSQNLWASTGFDLVNQDVELIGPLTRDKLRVFWARLDYDAIDLANRRPKWRVGGSLEVRQGLDILDATKTCIGAGCPVGATPTSRFDGSPSATLVRAQGEAEFALGRNISFSLSPRAQYAFKPLLSFEEYSAGNYSIGRGYDPGALQGDSGAGLSAELRGPRIALRQGSNVRFQPYVFGDAVWAWTKGISGSDRLLSAGGGVRADFGARFRLEASLAVPLEKTPLQTKRGDPRFLMTFTTRLLPWRTM